MDGAVRRSLGWEVLPVVGADAAALERVRASAVRCVVLVGEADTAVERMIAEREASVPLLVVGGGLRAGLAPACWLPATVAPAVISAMLTQLVGRAPAPRSWRRKGDMIIGQSPAVRELLAHARSRRARPTPRC